MAGHNYLSDPKNPFFSLENDVDDETFIKSAPPRPAVSPLYNSYNSNNHYSNLNNELEEKHHNLVSKKKEIEERTIQSSERSISLLRDSEEIGAATAEGAFNEAEILTNLEFPFIAVRNSIEHEENEQNIQ